MGACTTGDTSSPVFGHEGSRGLATSIASRMICKGKAFSGARPCRAPPCTGQPLCGGSDPAPARSSSRVGCAAKPELRDSASMGRGMLWEQGELAKEKKGGWEGGGIKHLPPTLEPLQSLKPVKSSSFNGNTSEISCKPCMPVATPSPHCPFVPATLFSVGRGANARLRHRHQLPGIPKCLESATALSAPSAPWSNRGQAGQGGALQHKPGSSQPAAVCKGTCCVADTSPKAPTDRWLRDHPHQQVSSGPAHPL